MILDCSLSCRLSGPESVPAPAPHIPSTVAVTGNSVIFNSAQPLLIETGTGSSTSAILMLPANEYHHFHNHSLRQWSTEASASVWAEDRTSYSASASAKMPKMTEELARI